ncbi:MAG: hypothetical protein MRY83_05770, partial [Flavobacteriales bacterium]|nr:hypothetical protein [Flavobacteriales bacterium]
MFKIILTAIVYLLVMTSGLSQNWPQIGVEIIGSGTNENCGSAISLNHSGNTVAVGSQGHYYTTKKGSIRVFEWKNNLWVQKGNTIYGDKSRDRMGATVKLDSSGNILVACAPQWAYGQSINGVLPDTGHVTVYEWDGIQWNPKGQKFKGQFAGDLMGYSASISADGNILALSTLRNTDFYGQVMVYQWNGIQWSQMGDTLTGSYSFARFGENICLSNDGLTMAIGIPSGGQIGSVRVYQWNGVNWIQKGADIIGQYINEGFGMKIDMDGLGTKIIVGAPRYNQNVGRVEIHSWNGNGWSLEQVFSNNTSNDWYGEHVYLSADGNKAIIHSYKPLHSSADLHLWDGLQWNFSQAWQDNNIPSDVGWAADFSGSN